MLREQTGMALLLTLLAVSFLVAVTVQLGSSVNWQMQAAANQKDLVQLDAMLLSGLHLAQAALLADQRDNKHDCAFDRWGTFDADALAAFFPEGRLTIKVTDMSGLLQVNALALSKEEKQKQEQQSKKPKDSKKKDKETLQRELWQRFLPLAVSFEDEKAEDAAASLVNCLADWIDEDDEERDNGAEQAYYSSLSPPYAPANRPLRFFDELRLVKGWKELLAKQPDIGKYLTSVGSDGKININAAPPLILQALDEGMTEDLANSLVEFRQQEENKDKLADPNWYKQVRDFPANISFNQDLITTSGSFFKVAVTASIKSLRRSGEGIVQRQKNQEQALLFWQAK